MGSNSNLVLSPSEKGCKFFPFRVDPVSEDAWRVGRQSASDKTYFP